jgi:hypothetical protein
MAMALTTLALRTATTVTLELGSPHLSPTQVRSIDRQLCVLLVFVRFYFVGMEGAHLVMQDLDGISGIGDVVTVTWANIAVDGAACVAFYGLFAEDMAADANDIDAGDFLFIDYSLDAGESWEKLLHFRAASFSTPTSSSNGLFYPDRDFDGQGDENERPLNNTAWLYSGISQPLHGASSLSLRLSARVEAGDEDAGFDSFRVMSADCPPLASRPLRRVLFAENFEGLVLQDTIDEGRLRWHALCSYVLTFCNHVSYGHWCMDAKPSHWLDC